MLKKIECSTRIILHLLIFLICVIFNTVSANSQTNKGTEFWIAFPINHFGIDGMRQLFITSETNTTVNISIANPSYTNNLEVQAGTLATISLPVDVDVSGDGIIENKGIHITSNSPITVYGMSQIQFTTDAYMALPVNALGTDYKIMSYSNPGTTLTVQMTVVATADSTIVVITPKAPSNGWMTNVTDSVLLNQGEVFQLRSNVTGADYTGSSIISNKPISVFGGNNCANIPLNTGYCDHLVEQMIPTNAWGQNFVTIPLATRTAGDIFRFLADEDDTQISINGSLVTTLASGQFFEQSLSSNSYNRITSNKPILVGQFSKGQGADSVVSDPFFALVPPDEQFLNNYTVSAGTSNIPNNFLNITSPTNNTNTVQVDGNVLPNSIWNAIPGTNISGAQVSITNGIHNISSSLPIGLLVYGFGDCDSYGYIGGQAFAAIATINSLMLSPIEGSALIGNYSCWSATVLDQFSNPVTGVRVDFNITGANSASSGFAFTDSNGVATYCYVGAMVGIDTIKAEVGNLNSSGIYNWTALAYPILKTPLNNSDNQIVNPNLTWEIVANAITYHLQVSTSQDFTSNNINQTEISLTSQQVENLSYSTQYFWRVRAVNGPSFSPWSDIWSFTTAEETVVAPTMQSANIVFSNVTLHSMKVRWTRGNGDRVLVVAYPGLGVNGLPVDGTNYSVGSAVGGGFVVYNGVGRICDVSGLASGTNYTFKAYEYFSSGLVYNKAASYLNPRSKMTLLTAPTNLVLEEVNYNYATVIWDFEGDANYYEVDIAYDPYFINMVPDYVRVDFGDAVANFVGLNSNTEYYMRVRANVGSIYSPWSNTFVFHTSMSKPTIAPTNAFVSNPTTNSLAVNWTKGNGDYSIVLASTSDISAYPEDGESYSANNNYALAPSLYGVKIVYSGTDNNFILSGLQANTEYHLAVYTFNGDNNNENYNITPAKAVGKTIDLAPTIAPTNFAVTNRASNSISANWDAGNSSKFIVLELVSGTEFTQAPVDGITYSVGGTLGNANIVAIGSANSISQSGLIPNTEYQYAVYGFNGANGSENYLDQALLGSGRTLALTPEAPTALAINSKSSNFMNLSWNGTASNYLVLASTSPITATPTNGYSYSGDATIDGAKVVYTGANSSDSVSNLIAETHYYFKIFAFNGSDGSEVYSSNYAVADGYTLANQPNAPIDLAFSNVTRNSMKLTWINPANSIVLMNTTGIFNFAPQAGQTYSEGSNDIYYIGSNNLLTLSNLNEETTYYFRIYSFNGTNSTTNYSENYADANQRTRSGVKQLVFTDPTPTMLTSGKVFSVRVAMIDDQGVPVISLMPQVSVQLAKTSQSGTLYGTMSAVVDANGYATFNNLAYVGTEQLILTVSMAGLSKSDTIAVEAATPTQQERAILFTNVNTNSMTVKWSRGNGSDRILVMKKGSAPIGTPWGIYQEGYPFGTSLIVGNSGYDGVVVFKGTTTQANITDLQPGITYFFRAYGYNNPTSPRYCTVAGSFNPRSRTTMLNKDDVAPNDELTEANINNNNYFISTVNPNPVVKSVNFKMTNLEDITISIAVFDAAGREVMKFVDEQILNKGTHDFNFDINDVLSSGTYLLVVTSGEQTAVQPFSIVK